MSAATTTNQTRAALLTAWRVYRAVVMQWTNTATTTGKQFVSTSQHAIRTSRLRSTWPDLADALDGLSQATNLLDPGRPWPCQACQVPIEQIRADVDPVTIAHKYVTVPCGHTLDRDAAVEAWNHGIDVAVTPINGSTLAAAERARQREEEGYDVDHDLDAYGDGDLSWAAWALLDRSFADPDAAGDDVPTMWPWSKEAWARHAARDPLRLRIIAAAVIQADIDRYLAAGGGRDRTE